MFYVYILQSHPTPEHFYVGSTSNLKKRFAAHNRGDSPHTAQHRPWTLVSYVAFATSTKAKNFEAYLKTHAGRKFQLRHLSD